MDAKPILEKKTITIEQAIKSLGGFKLFQWLIVLSFSIMSPPRVFQVLFIVFGGHHPTWRCVANSTVCLQNGTIASSNQERCDIPRNEWEYTVPRDYSLTTEYDLHCDRAWIGSLMNSIIFVGWGLGSMVLGYVADNFGRKLVIYPAQAMVLICGFVFSFVDSLPLFIVLRFIIGFFLQAGTVQSFVHVSEYVPSENRAVATLILFLSFSASSALFTLKSYFIRRWRLLCIVCTAPYVFTLFSFFYVPESIRWVRLKRSNDELLKIFKRIAYWNKKEMPTLFDVEIPDDDAQRKHSVIDIFRERVSALRSIALGYSWFSVAMVYYSFTFAAGDIGGSIYLNVFLYTVVGLPGYFAAMYSCNKFGRKRTVIVSVFIASIACLAVAFIPIEGDGKISRVAVALIGRFFIGLGFGAIYVWSVEVYPTTLRSNAMGYLQVTSRIGAASAPWVAKSLLPVHASAPYLVMGVSALVASFSMFSIPKTKDTVLKDTEIEDQEKHVINENA